MGNQTKPYERRVQVLKILQEYGALSPYGIAQIIEPPMKMKKLHTCLKRMKARKLIYERTPVRSYQTTPFFQISGRAEHKQTILSTLKANSTELRLPETKHEEDCHGRHVAIWAHRFKHWLPTASVVCRVNFAHNDHARDTLRYRTSDRGLTPDVLISVPSSTNEPTNIALTVNANLRFRRWPVHLFRTIASNPEIHGIINATGEPHFLDELENIRRHRWRTPHSREYGNNFFLCLMDFKPRLEKASPLMSSDFELVTLPDWIAYMESANAQKAAHFYTSQPAQRTPIFESEASMGGEVTS